MANLTKHNDVRQGPAGRFECAHFIVPRYNAAPPNPKEGEMWYDTSTNRLEIVISGSIKYVAFS